MSRFIIECPGCRARVDTDEGAPAACPECGVGWPSDLSERLEAVSARERPLGISLLMLLFAFWTGLAALALLRYLGTEGPFVVGGSEVPKEAALDFLLPVLVPLTLSTAGSALALWLEWEWARGTALLPFLLAALLPILAGGQASVGPAGDTAVAVAVLSPVIGVLVWYLYFKRNVRRYFETLRERRWT